MANTPTPK